MSFLTQPWSWTAGTAGRAGLTSDQCASHAAPCSIQRLTRSFCAALSFLCDFTGGMRSDSSSAMMRWYNSLSAGLPFTTGVTPSRAVNSPSSVSSRRPRLRVAGSGP